MKCLVIRCVRLRIHPRYIPAEVRPRRDQDPPSRGNDLAPERCLLPRSGKLLPCLSWSLGKCLSRSIWKALIEITDPAEQPCPRAPRAPLQMSTSPKDQLERPGLTVTPVARTASAPRTRTGACKEQEHLCACRDVLLFYFSDTLLDLN